ncbi:hypothetical protein CAEBREN_31471 [Caenorhabditis brenneri]|uniref:Uncharacterized protein n=1 Tax=Caenorhabditis brenneri TaxID=135651 RepID=G0MBX7_CAEBE|nr:hypothetical protein CAEBREN_31471 [Caenorhabditis brenneri]
MSFYEIPKFATSQEYINEITKQLREVSLENIDGEALTRTICILIDMIRATKAKMAEEKRDQSDLADLMQAIGNLQLQASK